MTDIVIRPRADEKYEIRVHDSDNGNLIVSSDQGYERSIDAEDQARKLFSDPRVEAIRIYIENDRHKVFSAAELLDFIDSLDARFSAQVEPARLTVEYRDGRVKSEVLR